MKKKINLLLICLLTFVMLFCGCKPTEANGILSITKTSTVGKVDTYTITFTDGSTFEYTVTNGSDGESLDIEDMFQAYKARYPEATFEDFLKVTVTAEETSGLNVTSKALLSSLKIYTQFTENYVYGWPYQQVVTKAAIYCGSGVIYKIGDPYTYIITNYHVLYDSKSSSQSHMAEKIVCYLYGSEQAPQSTGSSSSGADAFDYGEYAIECEFVGGSISTDVAVIRAKTQDILSINPGVKEIEFSSGYTVGETAIAIGNSEGEGISVTRGIVSVDNEYISYAIDGTVRGYRSMRIDTAIYGGNSGGGLFNSKGQLIGITNAGDGEDQNINYAIPVSIVKPVVENIMYYGKSAPKIVSLGVEVRSENIKYVYDENLGHGVICEDIIINGVVDGSLASTFGLLEGDKLVSFNINDNKIMLERYFQIADIIYTIRPNDVISFTFKRGDTTINSTEYTISTNDLIVKA